MQFGICPRFLLMQLPSPRQLWRRYFCLLGRQLLLCGVLVDVPHLIDAALFLLLLGVAILVQGDGGIGVAKKCGRE